MAPSELKVHEEATIKSQQGPALQDHETQRLLDERTSRLCVVTKEAEPFHATEKKDAEHLRAVLDGLPVGVLVTDDKCAIQIVNAAAHSYLGKKNALAVGVTVGTYFPVFDGLHSASAAAEIIGSAGNTVLARRADGAEFPCEVVINRVPNEDAFIWMIRDVTNRVEMEKRKQELEGELRQAHRLESLGTMAGGIAHELNTPIQFVSDNMRFLRDGFSEVQKALNAYSKLIPTEDDARIRADSDMEFMAAEIPNAIQQSLEGLGRVAEIVLAIKRFSYPSSDVKEDNDLNQIIMTTATVSKNQWKYVADLVFDLDSNLPPVKSNAGELNQVLINLIVNAAHAIEDKNDKSHKGTITISTRLVGNAVACSVSDTGVGIPSKNRDKIFDLFFTTKTPGRGTGQGLSLVHNIITHHGGRITVDSEVNKGTRFIFILPLEPSVVHAVRADQKAETATLDPGIE